MDRHGWKTMGLLLGMIVMIGIDAYGDEPAGDIQASLNTKVRITIGAVVVYATMENNAAARSFVDQLPLSIKMQDLAREEKYGYAPKKLDVAGAGGGYDPSPGDICSYVPWGNVIIYYREHGLENLVKLGTMDKAGIAQLASYPGDVTVSFEVVKF